MAIAEGAHNCPSLEVFYAADLPPWNICKNILESALCTESMTFFHPSACYWLWIFPAPGKESPLGDQDEAYVKTMAAPDLWV